MSLCGVVTQPTDQGRTILRSCAAERTRRGTTNYNKIIKGKQQGLKLRHFGGRVLTLVLYGQRHPVLFLTTLLLHYQETG
ncbi:hypothetical protein SKAU_G00305140 [Synaphobranchus kaupii]|uniref:Uncharacterized protein n=1 Tax=Synaphobranchus kaupii TaxID=118154 RepID=A0A9Q1EQM2_SYNKA|nr:hypothetical protein SKAU_G00305140 [Synaphobranchus kaupii]